ncbi:MAG: hypothetical protein JNK31_01555 [Candidatus Competibacter sp.]|nr:hypothetical protein [Candidatus Competibacter sp.]
MENQDRFGGSSSFERDVNNKVNRVAAGAHEAVDRAADATANAADRVGDTLNRVASGAHDAVNRAADMAATMADKMDEKTQQLNEVKEEWLDKTRAYVHEQPVKALLIALASGFVLSRLL